MTKIYTFLVATALAAQAFAQTPAPKATTTKSTEKPADRPAEKPTEKSAEKPASSPAKPAATASTSTVPTTSPTPDSASGEEKPKVTCEESYILNLKRNLDHTFAGKIIFGKQLYPNNWVGRNAYPIYSTALGVATLAINGSRWLAAGASFLGPIVTLVPALLIEDQIRDRRYWNALYALKWVDHIEGYRSFEVPSYDQMKVPVVGDRDQRRVARKTNRRLRRQIRRLRRRIKRGKRAYKRIVRRVRRAFDRDVSEETIQKSIFKAHRKRKFCNGQAKYSKRELTEVEIDESTRELIHKLGSKRERKFERAVKRHNRKAYFRKKLFPSLSSVKHITRYVVNDLRSDPEANL